jgi:FkbM family methyltransferase
VGAAPLVYVDCGARGGKLPRAYRAIRDSRYIGFDADADECARMNAAARPGHRYLPAFLGASTARRTFKVTASPACSSFLEPNLAFLESFGGLADGFRVEREIIVDTMTLDACLQGQSVAADFLELDTQGTELDILRGSRATLAASVVGLQVEVEFAPMYVDQPLFADVDSFLRAEGFQLFDLSRYRARRASLPAAMPTRGQLLWGHALYLRRVETVTDARAARLAVVAALSGCRDYAAEVLDRLASRADHELRHAAGRALDTLRSASATSPGDDQEPSRDRFLWRD